MAVSVGMWRHVASIGDKWCQVATSGSTWQHVVPQFLLHNVAKCGGLCKIKSWPRDATLRQVAPRGSMWFKKNIPPLTSTCGKIPNEVEKNEFVQSYLSSQMSV